MMAANLGAHRARLHLVAALFSAGFLGCEPDNPLADVSFEDVVVQETTADTAPALDQFVPPEASTDVRIPDALDASAPEAASPPPDVRSPDVPAPAVDVPPATGAYRVVVGSYLDLDERGYRSGGTPQTISCPDGTVGIGIDGTIAASGYDRDAPDLVRILCSRVQPDGVLNSVLRSDSAGFWDSTAPSFQNYCDEGEIAVGIHGKVSLTPTGIPFVSGLGLSCAPLVGWVAGTASARQLAPQNAAGTATVVFDDRCPSGSSFTRLQMRWSELTYSVRASCSRIVRD